MSEHGSPNRSGAYFPEIDAIRAFAICAVVATHTTKEAPGGFLGVDIFFVVSGFLIAHTSLSRGKASDFSLWQFWRRRIARIIPALIAVTLFMAFFAGLLLATDEDHRSFFGSLPYQAAFLQNFFFAHEGINYFKGLEAAKLNLHLWSIAIEEQFYTIFPLAVACTAATSRRPLHVLAVLALAALLISTLWPSFGVSDSARYYLTQYRIWQLSLGVLLALIVLNQWLPASWPHLLWLEIGAIAALIYAVNKFNQNHASNLMAKWLVCGATATLIAVAASGRSRILAVVGGWRPVAWVGQSSYSIYLWHWPVFAIFSYLAFDFGRRPFDAALYLVCLTSTAWASHALLEKRFRPFAHRHAAMVLVVFCSITGSLHFWPVERTEAENAILESARFSTGCAKLVCEHGDGTRGVLLWGDSHAQSIWEAVQAWGDESNRKVYAVIGCMPGQRDGNCDIHHQSAMTLIRSGAVDRVLLASRWSMYAVGFSDYEPEEKGNRFFSHRGRSPRNQREMQQIWTTALEDLGTDLEGIDVHVLLQVPQFPYFPPKEAVIDARGLRWRQLPAKTIDQHREDHRIVNEQFARMKQFSTIDAAPILCPDGSCMERMGSRVLYKDDDHLSVTGASLLMDALRRSLD